MAVPLIIKVFQQGTLIDTHRLELDLIRIGRRLEADVRVEDARASHIHCVIRTEADGTVLLEDRNSYNGTHVHGQSITTIPLPFGEEILVGSSILIVEKGET